MSKEHDNIQRRKKLHQREFARLLRQKLEAEAYRKATPNHDSDGWTFYPTRDFFGDEKSQIIRSTCIAVISRIDNLTNFRVSPSTEEQIYIELEQLNERFVELGIKTGMHTSKTEKEHQTNPQVMAEAMAGWLIPYMGRKLPSYLNIQLIAQEHSETSVPIAGGNFHFLEKEQFPQTAIDAIITQSVLNNCAHYLSIDPEELERIRF